MQVKAIFEKFDALSERERISVLLLFIVLIVIIFAELIIVPLEKKHNKADKNIITVQKETNTLKNQLLILKAKKKNQLSPKQRQQQKIVLLKEQVKNLNLRLKENMRGLIEPKEMAKVLEAVLSKNISLKLESMETLESKPLSPVVIKNGEKAEDLGIYRHGMRIKLKGSYLSTLKYLKALDDLPWNFYWDVLELNMGKYPVASIIITVHTLSFHKDWIGV